MSPPADERGAAPVTRAGLFARREPSSFRWRIIAPTIAAIVMAAAGFGGAAVARDWRYMLHPPQTLAQVERDVAARYSDVGQITVGELATAQSRKAPLLLVDVREADEFAVSRVRGAIRLDPDASVNAAKSLLSEPARGRMVVFYCSVGQRSSAMARRVQSPLIADGARGVVNLRGGIFAWHNAGLPLVNAGGATRYVHPYNAEWGRLLLHRDLVSRVPM